MGAIEHLTIALSTRAADKVRSRIASGDYANEGELVEQALAALDAFDDEIASILPEVQDADVEHWLNTEVVAILEEHRRDPGNVLSVEQVRESLAAARRARAGG